MTAVARTWLLVLTGAISGCGSLVGEQCRSPYSQCGHVCVDLASDPLNCGACGLGCVGVSECRAGACVPSMDSGVSDASIDARIDDAEVLDGHMDDGSLDSDVGTANVDAATSDVGEDDAPSDAASSDTGPPFSCAPLTECDGICADLATDPDHCGDCATSCGSGLCVAAHCESAIAGHLVVIGHDYESYRSAMGALLANAVLLPARPSVRILVWQGTATPAAISGYRTAIASGAGTRGYAISVAADASAVPSQLLDADAFLVLGQAGSTDAALEMLGSTWASALGDFIHAGGDVVVLDAPSATNAGTYQLLSSAGLFVATGRTELTLPTLTTVAGRAGDPVLLGVPLSYRGELHTTFFVTSDPDAIVSASSGPVVIDRTVAP